MEAFCINNYSFEKPLTSDNSGFSKWGIGARAGKLYFVKEFLSPTYPADDSVYTEKRKQDKIRLCKEYVEQKKQIYEAIRMASDGNIIVVEQFFRVGAKYYISTDAVTDPQLSIADISRRAFVERLRLCCSIAHGMARIHENHIIHADIKPDNILVVNSKSNGLKPNIIDFDCSFFEWNSPRLGEELNGDMVYLSPEGFLHIAGIESNLSCKMDVFALGLLFCQYLTGALPSFDNEEYQYAYESVLDGNMLGLDNIGNEYCRALIGKMLNKQPERRPDMRSVFNTLNCILLDITGRAAPKKTANAGTINRYSNENNSLYFEVAGDL